ncbi:TetR family transcriptional regulator [cyanobacterium TDX16]|nr:TetR family transcriptional regulator [cyanobacterium TDX16]
MPKIVDRDQYRKELLLKSFDLFAEKGYGSITMRQLAQGLGVSTGTLYHYFPSKQALFLQLVEELDRQDLLNFLAEAGNPPTLTERIETMFNFVAKNEDNFCKQVLLWVEFYQQEKAELSRNNAFHSSWDKTTQAIADYLQVPDKAIADFVLNYLYGLLMRGIFETETISYPEQATLLSKILVAYLE